MTNFMNKTLAVEQIDLLAKKLGLETALLLAINEVECPYGGFNADGTPRILFEPHVFYKRLTDKNLIDIRNQVTRDRPDLCYKQWGEFKYGLVSAQHDRLKIAATYHRESALEACSWGVGQIMGYHWQNLGYASLQHFINAMYKDEASQFEAMCRYLQKNNLIRHLKTHNWESFAYGYNGASYKKNNYHTKLEAAYKKYASKQG